jgi:hypothetical protein
LEAEAGRPADALGHLHRAIAGIDEAGVGIYLPEIYRLRGDCLLALDRSNKAEARAALATTADIFPGSRCRHFRTSRQGFIVRACNVAITGSRPCTMHDHRPPLLALPILLQASVLRWE